MKKRTSRIRKTPKGDAMTPNPTDIVNRRYDFVLLFDVIDGNPNGDPDAGNLPRLDPQSLQGLVTDGCLKRKIRNAIAILGQDRPGTDLYFQTQDAVYEKRVLNLLHQSAWDALGLKPAEEEGTASAAEQEESRRKEGPEAQGQAGRPWGLRQRPQGASVDVPTLL